MATPTPTPTAVETPVPVTPTGSNKGEIAPMNDTEPSKTRSTSITEAGADDKSGSPSPSNTIEKDADTSEMERRSSVVQALARSYSRASGGPNGNPFMAGEDSPLNPAGPNFSGREWAKAIVELVSQDGAAFRSSGICFQNLNVYGYGEATDYQKDVANVWLSLAGMVRQISASNRQRIDICQHFDGIVRTGEMLVVLGPPGSGCSTFLKTIAGEMNGLFVDDDSYFNYKGKSCLVLSASWSDVSDETRFESSRSGSLIVSPEMSRLTPRTVVSGTETLVRTR